MSSFLYSLFFGGMVGWALVSPDRVAPSWMVGVSASVNLPLHHKVQKFFSGIGSPRWSRKKGRKMVVCVYCFGFLLCHADHNYSHACIPNQMDHQSDIWPRSRISLPVAVNRLHTTLKMWNIQQLMNIHMAVHHSTVRIC